ncbi:nuclease SbcCD subunit C-like [Manduca sexta]|uniref:nuclease SbcCD subunit C-like n=1 Tax=Manduca sexta TaxID=7130 RepID=UPI001890B018|nr:nuclease SbcCD subunit C-like [Manduca sexta]
MEADISQKDNQIADLLSKFEQEDNIRTQMQFGYDAKIQERDLYIENLEAEIKDIHSNVKLINWALNYKKKKAYNEYTNQEDELVSRLAVLIDHDRVVEKQLRKIEDLELEFNTQIESAIKDKKVLNEKCEKYSERVLQLESQLQEYRLNIENLNLNIEDLNRVNEELLTKSSSKETYVAPDYTEQYISEINKLNSVISSKNQEISELTNKFHINQTNNLTIVSNLESNISDLNVKLNNASAEIARLLQDGRALKLDNEQLQILLNQKERTNKGIKNTKLTFEMNIPKTEGMVISSTIEPLSEESKGFDLSSIESQIISDLSEPVIVKKDKSNQASGLNTGISTSNPDNVSQSTFLDSAIEDELRIHIHELEKKVEELNVDLIKEKRDKESIKNKMKYLAMLTKG